MSFKQNNNYKKNIFMRFWRSQNSKVSLVRDVFVAFIFVLIILLILWSYTGQWFAAPMVAIESGSMEHRNPPYGRIGTIDAGDMVLLVKVNSKDDVNPFATSDEYHYGKKGDVVVYLPDGKTNTDQIIHRAMCWIEVEYINGEKVYTIEDADPPIIRQNASEPIYLPEFGIRQGNNGKAMPWFEHSGFITKGDNPDSNPTCDQIGNISHQLVKVEWITGKARGELPWIGTINLFFNDLFAGTLFSNQGTLRHVPQDSLDCLFVFLEFLILIPVSLDLLNYYKSKRKQLQNNEYTGYNIVTGDLWSIVIFYWLAIILLSMVSIFLIQGLPGDLIHLIIIIFIHIVFLYFFMLEIKLLKEMDIKKWLIICAFSGPIGVTIYYFYRLNKYQSGR